jgi:hypothetical protein
MAPRRFVYKLTADNGGAPCAYRGMLSLALCKPEIRRRAQEGEIVYGFAGSTLHRDNRLIYIARITGVAEGTSYWEAPRFRNRPDRIYEREPGGRFRRRVDAKAPPFHKDEGIHLNHDIGAFPGYKKARVLLSTDYRYFGGDSDINLSRYPALIAMVRGMRRGDRVHYDQAVEADLTALEAEAWTRFPKRRIGLPSQRDPSGRLSGGSCVVLDPGKR